MNTTWWVKPDDLDDRQKSVMDLPLTSSHLVIGPPGSGKTNLLLLRASQMVLSGKPNVLVLVFTRTLREFVATGGSTCAVGADKIQTLSGWSGRLLREYGIVPAQDKEFEQQRKMQIAQISELANKQKLSGVYDAIVLDEAQDYLAAELDMFSRLGRVVFAAADSRQKIYVTDDSTAPPLTDRFGPNVFRLKHHYRNGVKICQVADALAKSWEDFEPLSDTSQYDERLYPSSVTEHKCADLTAQVTQLVSALELQMKAYPDEYLGVLCPTRPALKHVLTALKSSRIGNKIVGQSAEDGYEQFDSSRPICVCSIHAAKGLEFRAAHILNAEDIRKSSLNRSIAYMAVTRAKTSLSFYHSKSLPGYLDGALSAIRPPVPPAKLEQLFR